MSHAIADLTLNLSDSIITARVMSTKARWGRGYEVLKKAVIRLGYARPGTLVRRFMSCGKPACRCARDRASWHGPYYQWTHKVRGKTITRRLTAAQARACAQWIEDHRRLKRWVRQMEALSLQETNRILDLGS